MEVLRYLRGEVDEGVNLFVQRLGVGHANVVAAAGAVLH